MRPNIFLVVVDALRADHLSYFGYPKETTPCLDEIARTGVVCEQAISTASWTIPSTYSILTGLYPHRHGYYDPRYRIAKPVQMIASALKERGYSTAAFSANGFVTPEFGFADGFDEFKQWSGSRHSLWEKMQGRLWSIWGNADAGGSRLRASLKRWIVENGKRKPFFGYVHLMEVHERAVPLNFVLRVPGRNVRSEFFQRLENAATPWGKLRGKQVAGKIDLLIQRYDWSTRYSDYVIESMISDLKQVGLWENTLAIFTADHGEFLGEGGNLRHGRSLDEVMLRIPLILSYPKEIKQPKSIGAQVQSIDIFPTILDAVDPVSREPRPGIDGLSLWPIIRGDDKDTHPLALAEHWQVDYSDDRPLLDHWESVGRDAQLTYSLKALRDHSRKFLRFGDGTCRMYDLRIDPTESMDIAAENSDETVVFSRILDELIEKAEPEPELPSSIDNPDLVEARLRDLGYIE